MRWWIRINDEGFGGLGAEEERIRLAHYLQHGPARLFANAAVEIETSFRLLETEPESARAGLESLAVELRQALTAPVMKSRAYDLRFPRSSGLGHALSDMR